MRLALIVEYDGTRYHGFQQQSNVSTIQEVLEKSIADLTGEAARVRAAGRTDAGVHALGQVVAFDTEADHPPDTFVRALNFHLPSDVAVKAAHRVDASFDPRRDALSRRYVYTILNSPAPSPLLRATTLQVREHLRICAMDQAAQLLVGTRDFARFSAPLERGSTVRRILSAAVNRSGELVRFDVEGSSFLPHQVRRMAGLLLEVGKGTLSVSGFEETMEGASNGVVAHSLSPKGLCLVSVSYAGFPPTDGE
jgi:tRNA pseudouridine38-40 synthase